MFIVLLSGRWRRRMAQECPSCTGGMAHATPCCYERQCHLENTRIYARVVHANEYARRYSKERPVKNERPRAARSAPHPVPSARWIGAVPAPRAMVVVN
jgi:hypothetical protein